MKNQVKDYVASLTSPVTSAAASVALVAGDCVVTDSGYLGVLVADTPVGGSGVADLAGIFRLAKAAGASMFLRQRVYWDNVNRRVTTARPAGAVNYVMVVESGPAAADTQVTVRLLPPLSLGAYAVQAVGNASGAGLTIDTGLGFIPTAVVPFSRDPAGNLVRVTTSIAYLSGGSSGQVTLVTGAGAATDVHTLIVYP